MNTTTAAERLLAYRAGEPLPTFGSWPVPRSKDADRLVLAFVRMAGETGMWGFVAGVLGKQPRVVTVPEPRNQDAAAHLAGELWEVLAPGLPHPSVFPANGMSLADWAGAAAQSSRTWQLCVPGPSHLDMLHHLNYRWTRAKKGPAPTLVSLNAVGRACGFLFRESSRPGQVRVLDLTARLREAWAFPAEGIRQAHLGYLLGFLESAPSLNDRIVAAEAEEQLAVGDTLDPDLERNTLEPLLRAWHDAGAGTPGQVRVGKQIHAVLTDELLRRFDLACRALRAIDGDPRPDNPRADELVDAGVRPVSADYFPHECRHLEAAQRSLQPPYVASPETDHAPQVAAARYFSHQRDQDASGSTLVHGDPVLAQRLVAAGAALAGQIGRVARVAGRKYPVWAIDVGGQGSLSLREGSRVELLGLPQRHGRILEMAATPNGRRVLVEITNGTRARPADGAPAADAQSLRGQQVVLVGANASGISMRKLMRIREMAGPGSWLLGKGTRPQPRVSGTSAARALQIVRNLEKGKKP